MPDNSLQVTSAYLEQLAVEQEEAAAEINSAMAETDGLAYKLIWDHGFISAVFWGAMFITEKEREAACTNMVAVSNEMAANLRAARTAYTGTDTQSSEDLSQQMMPG
ncbi:type VII secretion target [Mycobacterium lentiflavum]|uniref:ESX-1 secretion-associated protein n=1 Tax=Mycobacterium lentiflavum TaxID=141349 RepID=A0ABY3UUY3_MYCLN|nr:type VII secretion target [Mycobacterium lentiflavum]ULP40946.1 ESX-1 secretion-associated protein [Mycobacterium lentiflavum]